MDGPFSFSEAPDEFLDFLQEKRRQMLGLVLGSTTFGTLAAAFIAAARGEPSEALVGAQAMLALTVFTLIGLGAYGLTQGGLRREL